MQRTHYNDKNEIQSKNITKSTLQSGYVLKIQTNGKEIVYKFVSQFMHVVKSTSSGH